MAVLDVLLKILHVFVCLVLMFVVLLQQGRGGGLGAAFGGGAASQVFGGRGAGNLLTRATAILATVFMLLSLTLALMNRGTSGVAGSLLGSPPASAPAPAPPAPEPPKGPAVPTN